MNITDIQAPKDEILKRFPEMAPIFTGECAPCIKKRIRTLLINKARQGVDMTGIPEDWYKGDMPEPAPSGPSLSYTEMVARQARDNNRIRNPQHMAADERKACPQCVLKHLSCALILLDEAELGYPDHLELAANQLIRAAGLADQNTVKDIMRSVAALRSGKALELLSRAKKDLAEVQLNLGAPNNRSYWKAVGHLAEAEAECLGHDKDLAEQIRLERIMVMNDPTYVPDLTRLLGRLSTQAVTASAGEKLAQDTVNPQVTDA